MTNDLPTNRRNYLRTIARGRNIPDMFVDDAVQDVLVGLWREQKLMRFLDGEPLKHDVHRHMIDAWRRYGPMTKGGAARFGGLVGSLDATLPNGHPVHDLAAHQPPVDELVDAKAVVALLPPYMQRAVRERYLGVTQTYPRGLSQMRKRVAEIEQRLIDRANGIVEDCGE